MKPLLTCSTDLLLPAEKRLTSHDQPFVEFAAAPVTSSNLPDGLVFEIVLTGEVRIFEQGRLVRAVRAELLLSGLSDYVRETSADYTAIKIIVDQDYLMYCLWPLVGSLPPSAPQEFGLVGSIPEPDLIRQDVSDLLHVMVSRRPYAGIISRHLARQILLKILLAQSPAIPSIFLLHNAATNTLISYFLEGNFTRKLSVRQLAAMAGKSLSAFKRDFALEYGIPPLQWLVNRRLEYAYCLIRIMGLL